jgi:hypothetical protein
MTKLQDYNFIIRHVGGPSNVGADALSRPKEVEKPEKSQRYYPTDSSYG